MARQMIVVLALVVFVVVYAAPSTATFVASPDSDTTFDPFAFHGESESSVIGPITGGNSYADMVGAPVPLEFFAPPDPNADYDVQDPTAYQDYAFVNAPAPAPNVDPIAPALHAQMK